MSGEPPKADAEGTPARLRGLWSVMRSDEPTAPPESEPASVDEPPPVAETSVAPSPVPLEAEEAARPAPRGLWALMQHAAAVESAAAESENVGPDDDHSPQKTPVAEWSPTDDDEAFEEQPPPSNDELELVPATPVATVGRRDATGELSRRATQACLIGLVAVPLSALALLPDFWAGTPAAVSGFAALVIAVSVLLSQGGEAAGVRLRAGMGAVLGVLALLLGPFAFTPWGNSLREARTERSTIKHLRAIGTALQTYQQENGAYPVGGTHIDVPNGPRRGGHGWMTRLLPALNEAALYQRINQQLPFDDPANLPALGTSVETFFAAGGDRQKLPSGLAVAHFAGVGGSVRPGRGETLAAGIFELDRAVTATDVLDGLSQTLVAGELPGGYPPWGDPENFRLPGRGINKDSRGFGNSSQTGAVMLFADGRAKFFGNQTDPELLQRLATRDAGDLAGNDLP
jgi:hypothetical protein